MYTIIIAILLLASMAGGTWGLKNCKTALWRTGSVSAVILSLLGGIVIILSGAFTLAEAHNLNREHLKLKAEISYRIAKLQKCGRARWCMTPSEILTLLDLQKDLIRFNQRLFELGRSNNGIYDLFIPDKQTKLKPLKLF